MTTSDAAATPAPDPIRRGGSGPEGPDDPTDEYVISIDDVLSRRDPEPPAGTIVKLHDGTLWKRLPILGDERCWGSENNGWRPVWRWVRVTFDGPVTVVGVPGSSAVYRGPATATRPTTFVTRHRLVTVDGRTHVEFQDTITELWHVAEDES